MLSFLRDQSNEDSPAQQSDAAGQAVPGESAEKPQEEFLTVAAHQKRTRKSTTLLAILFIAGMLCLAYMIKKSTPKAATAAVDNTEETQLEAAITRLTGAKSEMFNSMDKMVKKFYEFSDVLQVKVGELAKNPFKLELVSTKVEEPRFEIKVPEVDTEKVRQMQIRQQAKELQLLSIMKSDRGKCCMIGDKILAEGEYIKDFKVSQISDTFVKLEWNPKITDGSSDIQSEPVEIMLNLSE